MSVSRIFTAVPAPVAFVDASHEYRRQFRLVEGIRWVPEANLHLTLCFLGEVEDADLPEVISILDGIASSHEQFTLTFDRFGAAGKADRPSMLWGYFIQHEGFKTLYHSLRTGLQPILREPGVLYPDPIPHITIARTTRPSLFRGLPEAELKAGPLTVDRIGLWKTIREPALHYQQIALTGPLK